MASTARPYVPRSESRAPGGLQPGHRRHRGAHAGEAGTDATAHFPAPQTTIAASRTRARSAADVLAAVDAAGGGEGADHVAGEHEGGDRGPRRAGA